MYTLPQLSYGYDALEPYIDAETMRIHHTKHHQTYIDKLNTALASYPDLQNLSVEDLLKNFATIPDDIKTAVKNHGGGHANHSLWWKIIGPSNQTPNLPSGKILDMINANFTDFESCKKQFSDKATSVFGSGWVWLVSDGKVLSIITTPNQDSPLMQGLAPLLGLDVWEHAYYLKYQNRRADYITNFFNVVNWKEINNLPLNN